MYLINRHLLKTATGPFFFGLSVITFVMMIDTLFKCVEYYVTKDVPFQLVAKFLLLSLGHLIALSVPMAVMIAVLMSIGQLAADQEITAMKASGISLLSVLKPLIFGAFMITLGMTAYNHYIFPESNHALANLMHDLQRTKPMLEIRERQFTEMGDAMTIYVAEKDEVTGEIKDVRIFEKPEKSADSPRLTIAKWGRIVPDHATDSILIELHDGETHEIPDKHNPDKYNVTRFGQHNLYVANMEKDFKNSDRQARSDREMNLHHLWAAAAKEEENREEVFDRVDDLQGNFLNWQWQLLDPKRRNTILGRRVVSDDIAKRESYLKGKFQATALKVRRIAEQSGFQNTIVENFVVRKNRYLVEFHKKFSIPFACVVFTLIGVPMAVTSSRSGKGISATLAIGVYTVYYFFLVGGEKLADRGLLSPFLAMWSANIVLACFGIIMFHKTMREASLFSFNLRPNFGRPVAETSNKTCADDLGTKDTSAGAP